jgi:hypothetical protein
MPTPTNPKLYAKAKADRRRDLNSYSAFKSGFIVKTYKRLGGVYKDDKNPKKLEEMVQRKVG